MKVLFFIVFWLLSFLLCAQQNDSLNKAAENDSSFIKGKAFITSRVLDENGSPIQMQIEVFDNTDGKGEVEKINSNSAGYSIISVLPGKKISIVFNKPGYLFQSFNIDIPNSKGYGKDLKDITLQKAIEGKKTILKNISFDFDQSQLHHESFSDLDLLISLLNNTPSLQIEISGNTNNFGSENTRLSLSEQRAKAVADYLIDRGVDKNRLQYKGYGSSQPIASNSTDEGRRANNRIELKVLNANFTAGQIAAEKVIADSTAVSAKQKENHIEIIASGNKNIDSTTENTVQNHEQIGTVPIAEKQAASNESQNQEQKEKVLISEKQIEKPVLSNESQNHEQKETTLIDDKKTDTISSKEVSAVKQKEDAVIAEKPMKSAAQVNEVLAQERKDSAATVLKQAEHDTSAEVQNEEKKETAATKENPVEMPVAAVEVKTPERKDTVVISEKPIEIQTPIKELQNQDKKETAAASAFEKTAPVPAPEKEVPNQERKDTTARVLKQIENNAAVAAKNQEQKENVVIDDKQAEAPDSAVVTSEKAAAKVFYERHYIYIEPIAIAKVVQADSLNKQAFDKITQSINLKSKAAKESNDDVKISMYEQAEVLINQAKEDKFKAFGLNAAADNFEYTSNKKYLEQIAKASSKNATDDILRAEVIKDDADKFFLNAQNTRATADLNASYDSIEAVWNFAYKNEMTALEKQKESMNIYKKYNPDFVLSPSVNAASVENGIQVQKDTLITPEKPIEMVSANEAKNNEKKETAVTPEKPAEILAPAGEAPAHERKDTEVTDLKQSGNNAGAGVQNQEPKETGADKQSETADSVSAALNNPAPPAIYERHYIYTEPAAIAKTAKADSLNKQAADKMTQWNNLKSRAVKESNDDVKISMYEQAEVLISLAKEKTLDAFELNASADNIEYSSNKKYLEQIAKASSKNTSDDILRAEVIKDDAGKFFTNAQNKRAKADLELSFDSKEAILDYAYKNEITALEKQKESMDIYKKYNPDFVLSLSDNSAVAEKETHQQKDTLITPEKQIESVSANEPKNNEKKETAVASEKPEEISAAINKMQTQDREGTAPAVLKQDGNKEAVTRQSQEQKETAETEEKKAETLDSTHVTANNAANKAVIYERHYLYIESAAIEKAAKADSLNKLAAEKISESDNLKLKAAKESNDDIKISIYEQAESLKSRAKENILTAFDLNAEADNIEYSSNKKYLELIAKASSKNTSEDILRAEEIKEEADKFFSNAQSKRAKAVSSDSFDSKEIGLDFAYKIEMTALEKQKESMDIYKKYNPDFVVSVITNDNAVTQAPIDEKTEPVSPPEKKAENASVNEVPANEQKEAVVTSEKSVERPAANSEVQTDEQKGAVVNSEKAPETPAPANEAQNQKLKESLLADKQVETADSAGVTSNKEAPLEKDYERNYIYIEPSAIEKAAKADSLNKFAAEKITETDKLKLKAAKESNDDIKISMYEQAGELKNKAKEGMLLAFNLNAEADNIEYSSNKKFLDQIAMVSSKNTSDDILRAEEIREQADKFYSNAQSQRAKGSSAESFESKEAVFNFAYKNEITALEKQKESMDIYKKHNPDFVLSAVTNDNAAAEAPVEEKTEPVSPPEKQAENASVNEVPANEQKVAVVTAEKALVTPPHANEAQNQELKEGLLADNKVETSDSAAVTSNKETEPVKAYSEKTLETPAPANEAQNKELKEALLADNKVETSDSAAVTSNKETEPVKAYSEKTLETPAPSNEAQNQQLKEALLAENKQDETSDSAAVTSNNETEPVKAYSEKTLETPTPANEAQNQELKEGLLADNKQAETAGSGAVTSNNEAETKAYERYYIYIEPAAIEKVAEADSINKFAADKNTESDKLKIKAAKENNDDLKISMYEQAGILKNKAKEDMLLAFNLNAEADNIEYSSNKKFLDQIARVSSKNTSDDILRAEEIREQADKFYSNAQSQRAKGGTAESFESKEAVLDFAYKNEMTALEKQKESMDIYKKYNPDFVVSAATADNAVAEAPVEEKTEIVSPPEKQDENVSMNVVSANDQKETEAASEKPVEISSHADEAKTNEQKESAVSEKVTESSVSTNEVQNQEKNEAVTAPEIAAENAVTANEIQKETKETNAGQNENTNEEDANNSPFPENYERQYTYHDPSAIEKAENADSLNKQVADMMKRSVDLKSQAQDQNNTDINNKANSKADELMNQAKEKRLRAFQLCAEANNIEYSANKNYLDQVAKVSSKNNSDDIVKAGEIKDDAKKVFENSEKQRAKADLTFSYDSKEAVLFYAYKNAITALENQKASMDIYKRYYPDFVVSDAAATDNTAEEPVNEKTEAAAASQKPVKIPVSTNEEQTNEQQASEVTSENKAENPVTADEVQGQEQKEVVPAYDKPAENNYSADGQVNMEVKNIGPVLNSPFQDYAPLISADGSTLIFTSRRPLPSEEPVQKPKNKKALPKLKDEKANIYISKYDKKNQNWSEPKMMESPINRLDGDNTAAGLSNDGQRMLLYRADNSGENANGHIFESVLNGKKWTEPARLPKPVNSDRNETSASIAPDGKTLYFISNRLGGLGGKDIWYCTQGEDGVWGEAINMGDAVNTREDEESVFIHPNGKVLFFSSKGHNSLGGYDIFMSEYDESANAWSAAQSAGIAINTPADEMYFVMEAGGQKAYFVSSKPKGIGENDIYSVTIIGDLIKKSTAILKGIVSDEDGKFIKSKIEIKDRASNKIIGVFASNKASGKYLVSFPADKGCEIKVTAKGYTSFVETIDSAGSPGYNEIVKNIVLESKNAAVVSTISDEKGKPLTVQIDVIDNTTKQEMEKTESSEGASRILLPSGRDYGIVFSKPGYFFQSYTIAVPKQKGYEKVFKIIFQNVEPEKKSILNGVSFDPGQAVIKQESISELDRLSTLMNEMASLKIEIGGYTDKTGSSKEDKNLSEQRAKAVADYLIVKGCDKKRLKYKGYGSGEPAAGSSAEDGHIINSRIELKVLKMDVEVEKIATEKRMASIINPFEKQVENNNQENIQDQKETPSDVVKEIPSDEVKETPSDVVKETPSDEVKETPSDVVKETPSDEVKETPTDVVKETPSDEVKETPTDVVKETPSDEVKETPTDVVKETPSDEVKETPSDAVKQTPADVVNETPSDAVKETKNGSLIPDHLKMYDIDLDGKISYNEVIGAIDTFFDENSTSKAAEVYSLIDYFFDE